MKRAVFSGAMLVCFTVAALLSSATGQEKAKSKDLLKDLKCFIMKKRKVKKTKVVKYKGAKLYLCCGTCVKRMKKTPQKYEAKANHQVVYTGQFVQKACPISGKPLGEKSAVLKVGGVAVKFASTAHKDKVAKLKADKQIEAVFGKGAFKKGQYQLVKKKKKSTKTT